jgi:hypothetical protein
MVVALAAAVLVLLVKMLHLGVLLRRVLVVAGYLPQLLVLLLLVAAEVVAAVTSRLRLARVALVEEVLVEQETHPLLLLEIREQLILAVAVVVVQD